MLTDHAAREGGGGGAIADPKAAERGSRYAVLRIRRFGTPRSLTRLAGRRGGWQTQPPQRRLFGSTFVDNVAPGELCEGRSAVSVERVSLSYTA